MPNGQTYNFSGLRKLPSAIDSLRTEGQYNFSGVRRITPSTDSKLSKKVDTSEELRAGGDAIEIPFEPNRLVREADFTPEEARSYLEAAKRRGETEAEAIEFAVGEARKRIGQAAPQEPLVTEADQDWFATANARAEQERKELARQYAEAGTPAQPELALTLPSEAALSVPEGIASLALQPVKSVVEPIHAGAAKFFRAKEALENPRVDKMTNPKQFAKDLSRNLIDAGTGVLETWMSTIPAVAGVHAVSGVVGEPMAKATAAITKHAARGIAQIINPTLDKKILDHISENYGAIAGEKAVQIGGAAYFGLPVLTGMIVSDVGAAVTDKMVTDSRFTEEDKERIRSARDHILFFSGMLSHVAAKRATDFSEIARKSGEGIAEFGRELGRDPLAGKELELRQEAERISRAEERVEVGKPQGGRAVEELPTETVPSLQEFKSTNEAIEFGKSATADQLQELATRQRKNLADVERFKRMGKSQEAINAGTRAQFDREAIESAQQPPVSPIGEQPQIVKPPTETVGKGEPKIPEKRLAIRDIETGKVFIGTEGEPMHLFLADKLHSEGLPVERMETGFIDRGGNFVARPDAKAGLGPILPKPARVKPPAETVGKSYDIVEANRRTHEIVTGRFDIRLDNSQQPPVYRIYEKDGTLVSGDSYYTTRQGALDAAAEKMGAYQQAVQQLTPPSTETVGKPTITGRGPGGLANKWEYRGVTIEKQMSTTKGAGLGGERFYVEIGGERRGLLNFGEAKRFIDEKAETVKPAEVKPPAETPTEVGDKFTITDRQGQPLEIEILRKDEKSGSYKVSFGGVEQKKLYPEYILNQWKTKFSFTQPAEVRPTGETVGKGKKGEIREKLSAQQKALEGELQKAEQVMKEVNRAGNELRAITPSLRKALENIQSATPEELRTALSAIESVEQLKYLTLSKESGEILNKAKKILEKKIQPPAETMVRGGEQDRIVSAAAHIGGKVFTGKTHGETLQKAIEAGEVVKKEGGLYDKHGNELYGSGWNDLFQTASGELINRFEASRRFDISATEDLQPAEVKPTESQLRIEGKMAEQMVKDVSREARVVERKKEDIAQKVEGEYETPLVTEAPTPATLKQQKRTLLGELEKTKEIVKTFDSKYEKIDKAEQGEVLKVADAFNIEVERLESKRLAGKELSSEEHAEYWSARHSLEDRYNERSESRKAKYDSQRRIVDAERAEALKAQGFQVREIEDPTGRNIQQVVTEIPGDGTFFTPLHNLEAAIDRVQTLFPTTIPKVEIERGPSGIRAQAPTPSEIKGKYEKLPGTEFYTIEGKVLLRGEPPKKYKEAVGEHEKRFVTNVEKAKQFVSSFSPKNAVSAQKLGYVEKSEDLGTRSISFRPVPGEGQAIFKIGEDYYLYPQSNLNLVERMVEGGEYRIAPNGELAVFKNGKLQALISPTASPKPEGFEARQAKWSRAGIEEKYGDISFLEAGERPPQEAARAKTREQEETERPGFAAKAKPKIPTTLEAPTEKPVKASEIISRASKELNVPIRVGHARWGRRLGFFKVKPEVVRMKEANDLGIMSHEVAHYIDKKFLGGFKGKVGAQRFRPFHEELGKLDYEYPKKRRSFEGFAEFVRHYLTMDDAAQVAPKFYEHFTSEILGKNPELAKTVGSLKESITQWRKQGAEARVLSQIDWDGGRSLPLRERLSDAWLRFKAAWSNDLEPLNYAVKEILKTTEIKLEPRENPFAIATFVARTSPAKARAFVLDGAFDFSGNRVGKSLKEVVAPVSDEIQQAIAYAYAKRAVGRLDKGINPGITREDAQFVINKYKNRPEFENFAKEVTEWNGYLLDYLTDGGGLSAEAATLIRESDVVYIPLKRVFVDREPSFAKGRGFADLPSVVKRMKGSGREVQEPLSAMIQQAEQIIAVADKARVARSIVDLAEKGEGLGRWIERIEPPVEATRMGLEKLRSELESQGLDVIQRATGEKLKAEDMDAVVTLFSQSSRYYGKDNVISVYRNGKREFYEVHPELFRVMKNLDAQTLPWFINVIFGKPARAMRLGATGIRAGFTLITNPIRDAQTFAVQREGGLGLPTEVWRGYEHIVGKGELRQRFKAAGVEISQPLGLDRRLVENLVDEVLANDAKAKTLNVARHPVEALKQVLSITESAPRLTEFEAVWKKWQPQIDEALARGDNVRAQQLRENANIEAGNAAADVTVNFRRAGYLARIMNQIIPFFNPGIQGPTKMLRTIREHPVRSAARAAGLLTAPTLALWWMNKDEDWYKNLPAWQKYGFWNFKIGDEIIRLPKPFEWGYIFAGIPEGVADAIYNSNPEAIKEAVGQAAEAAVPPLIPALVDPAMEAYFNWDLFRKRPIVPESQKDLLESEQYLPYTSETAKEIGKILNVSPAKIDHLISGYTGGLALDVLNALPKEYRESADIPVIGRLFTRQDAIGFGGQNVRRLYDELEKATKYKRTVDTYLKLKAGDVPDLDKIERAVEILGLDKNAVSYYASFAELNRTALQLKELRNMQRNMRQLDVEEGIQKQVNMTLNRTAGLLSANAVRLLREFESARTREPVEQ